MEIPPEVLLDRFFKSDCRTPTDRAAYRGKQDLEQLPPAFGSLLASIQTNLNKALRQRDRTFEKGNCSRFHFDYINATVSNALAFEYEGYGFLAVTMPLIKQLWRMSEHLARSAKVRALLIIAEKSEVREAASVVLFLTQLNFLVAHEFAHHDHGHFRESKSAEDLANALGSGYGSLEEQAREIAADRWAVYLALPLLVVGDLRIPARKSLGLIAHKDEDVDVALLSFFIVAVAAVLFIFPSVNFDEKTLYTLSHPPHPARMNAIMHAVQDWCTHNKSGLVAWLTLQQFQSLLLAASDATAELCGHPNWRRETEFLLTEAGREYIARLNQHVKLLVGAL